MKKLAASLLLAVMLLTVPTPVHLFASKSGLARAMELFIPIACTSPEVPRWKTGTGFPVGEHMVMTAGHVDCQAAFGVEAVTEIFYDSKWIVVPNDAMFVHGKYDARVYV